MSFKIIKGIWYYRCKYRNKEYLRSLKIKGEPGSKPTQRVKRKAEEVLEEIKGNGRARVSQGMDYKTLAEKYKELHIEQNSKNPKMAIYQLGHSIRFFGKYRLWEITKELIVRYERERLKQGIRKSTLNREKAYFRAVLKYAAKLKLADRNEVQSVIELLDFHDEREFIRNRNLKSSELKSLVAECPIHAAVTLLIGSVSMARVGEILGAKWKDIIWDRCVLFLGKTKNGEPRYVPLSIGKPDGQIDIELLKILVVWQSYQYDYHEQYNHIKPDNIITYRGHAIKGIRGSFNRALEDADIDDLRPHDLRHYATTRFKRLGHDDNVIRKGSGHRDIGAYNRYLDYSNELDALTGLGSLYVPETITCNEFIKQFKLDKYRSLVDCLGLEQIRGGIKVG